MQAPHIDVDCTDVRMTTPLHWYGGLLRNTSTWDSLRALICRAAVCNRADICALLIAAGCETSFRDVNGMTALHYATTKGFSIRTSFVSICQRIPCLVGHLQSAQLLRQGLAGQEEARWATSADCKPYWIVYFRHRSYITWLTQFRSKPSAVNNSSVVE